MPLRFFANAEELRDWFRDHHDKLDEQWIGFYKKHTRASMHSAVDVPLSFPGSTVSARVSGHELQDPVHATPGGEPLEQALPSRGWKPSWTKGSWKRPGSRCSRPGVTSLQDYQTACQAPARVAEETDPGPSQGMGLPAAPPGWRTERAHRPGSTAPRRRRPVSEGWTS